MYADNPRKDQDTQRSISSLAGTMAGFMSSHLGQGSLLAASTLVRTEAVYWAQAYYYTIKAYYKGADGNVYDKYIGITTPIPYQGDADSTLNPLNPTYYIDVTKDTKDVNSPFYHWPHNVGGALSGVGNTASTQFDELGVTSWMFDSPGDFRSQANVIEIAALGKRQNEKDIYLGFEGLTFFTSMPVRVNRATMTGKVLGVIEWQEKEFFATDEKYKADILKYRPEIESYYGKSIYTQPAVVKDSPHVKLINVINVVLRSWM